MWNYVKKFKKTKSKNKKFQSRKPIKLRLPKEPRQPKYIDDITFTKIALDQASDHYKMCYEIFGENTHCEQDPGCDERCEGTLPKDCEIHKNQERIEYKCSRCACGQVDTLVNNFKKDLTAMNLSEEDQHKQRNLFFENVISKMTENRRN